MSYTLKQHAQAAIEVVRHLARLNPDGWVMLNTSRCVGWLACLYPDYPNESSGRMMHPEARRLGDNLFFSDLSIDLFLAGDHWLDGKLDLVRKDLLREPAFREEHGQLVFDAHHDSISKRSYRLNLDVTPHWVTYTGWNRSIANLNNLCDAPPDAMLLYLLYQLADAPRRDVKAPHHDVEAHRRDVKRLYDTLTVVYIFSRLIHARHRAPRSQAGSSAMEFHWDGQMWATSTAKRALKDPQHLKRYERVLDMFKRRDEGPLVHDVLKEWAMSLVSQANNPAGQPFQRVLVRIQSFLNDVAAMILRRPDPAFSLGKSLPVGMAVFHPDSARRRAFEGAA
ncbi:hypothetical protein JCM3775_006019 [Rhodotorula graminis]